jgi:phosphoribosylaminoimidazole-succinocarboxamide synthase
MENNAVYQTDIKPLKLFKRGKVRDVYELRDDYYLIVATDRISCFDVVLPTPIPDKGKVLNQISCWWFDFFKDQFPSHFVSSDLSQFPELNEYSSLLTGRCMIGKKAKPLPVECVVRGYLVGSGWREYQQNGSVCGIKLPENLEEAAKLETPIFTPASKAEEGEHDENINYSQAQEILGPKIAEQVKNISIKLYKQARDYAANKGIIIADTKFEFGIVDGQLILIDEIFTPDSSRFWPEQQYKPSQKQPSFDKQFVRDYLQEINWDKNPPAPVLPQEVVVKTQEKYKQALKMLTGKNIKG